KPPCRSRQTLSRRQPCGQILMTDDELRPALGEMRKTARAPALDRTRALGCDFGGGVRPSVDQLTLQLAVSGREPPVAAIPARLVSGFREELLRPLGGPGAERLAESLVRQLMTIHQITDQGVVRLFGRALHPAVIGEREKDRRALIAAT